MVLKNGWFWLILVCKYIKKKNFIDSNIADVDFMMVVSKGVLMALS